MPFLESLQMKFLFLSYQRSLPSVLGSLGFEGTMFGELDFVGVFD
ncbi:hypothetical protein [Bacillus alveayuensis]